MPDARANIEKSKVKTGIQIFVLQSAFSLAITAHADTLQITPTVNLKETYNDNVVFAPAGSEISAWITEVTPGVIVNASGPAFKADLNYSIQELNYSGESHAQQTNQMLAATSKEELIKDIFYFQNSANISQLNYSPFAPQTTNNLTLSNNRYEVKTYDLEPYLQANFSQEAMGEIRFIHNYVNTTNSGLADSTANTVRAFLQSGPTAKTVDWNLLYSDEKINYRTQNNLEMQSTTLSGGYHTSSEFALTASVGYEKNNYFTQTGEKPEGDFWSLGFKWTPSERTNLAASFGRHYYGNTYSLIFNERTYATVWNVGYNDGLMTSRGQFFVPTSANTYDFLNSLWQASIPDQTQRQQAIDAFIQSTGLPATLTTPVNTITQQVFIQKYLQGSVAYSGLRNTLIFSLFNIRRDAESDSLSSSVADANQFSNTKQTGANIMWDHTLTPRTNSVLALARTKSTSDSSNIVFDNNTITTSLNHQWDPKLKATLGYQHIQSTANFSGGNARDNMLYLLLAYRF